MNDEDPVRRLHAAVETIRKRANSASPGPWIYDEDEQCWRLHSDSDPGFPSMQILKAPKYGTPYAEYWPKPADADHIVRWHPGVAKLVANLLTAVSGTDPKQPGYGLVWITALRVASALGADPIEQEQQ